MPGSHSQRRVYRGPRSRDASLGYRLAEPYRQWESGQRFALAERTATVPLARVASAPAVVAATSPKRTLEHSEWKCRGCDLTDRSRLCPNDEGTLVCPDCGVCAEGVAMVATTRQKNCHRDDDRTVVADEARPNDGAVAATELTTSAMRASHVASVPGTKLHGLVAYRAGMGSAQSQIETAIVADARSGRDGTLDANGERKLCTVMRVLEQCFDAVAPLTLEKRLKEHIRMEAGRIVRLGAMHAERCTLCANCPVNIPARSNRLVATCAMQAILQRLASTEVDANGKTALQRVTTETTVHSIVMVLQRLKQALKATAATQQAEVDAAVSIVLGWNQESACLPCSDGSGAGAGPGGGGVPKNASQPSSVPPPLLLPPPLVASASHTSLDTQSETPTEDSQADSWELFEVRDKILAAATVAASSSDVRHAALDAIGTDGVGQWIREENNFPSDLLGVVILGAAAANLGQEDCFEGLLARVCAQNSISTTTARQVRGLLLDMMQAQPKFDVVNDGIF